MIRIAINGFGRIGRQVLQAGIKDKKIKFVAVNDLTSTENLAYLLKYDSVYGKFPYKISNTKNTITVDGQKINIYSERDPEKLPWKQERIDIVVESSGVFRTKEGASKHIKAGAKKVLISAPSKDCDYTIVCGINDKEYNKKYKIISNASCTTNCVAHLVKILDDAFRIKKGYMVTTHSYTADQKLIDAPHSKDLRRGRAAAQNIIPTSTGAAKTVCDVIPKLKGKIDGVAWRVPTICGSIVMLTAEVGKKTDAAEVNKIFKKACSKSKVVEYNEDPIVSHDIIQNPHSCIFDSLQTNVMKGNLVSVTGWYDNEWGFSCRMIDVLKLL